MRERWPNERTSSGENQRALRSFSYGLGVMAVEVLRGKKSLELARLRAPWRV